MAPNPKTALAYYNKNWYAISEVINVVPVVSNDIETEMVEVVFKTDGKRYLISKDQLKNCDKLIKKFKREAGMVNDPILLSDEEVEVKQEVKQEDAGFVGKFRRSLDKLFKRYDDPARGETSKAADERAKKKAETDKPETEETVVTFDSYSICGHIIHAGLKAKFTEIDQKYSRAEFAPVLVLKDLVMENYPELYKRASDLDRNDKLAKYKMLKELGSNEAVECEGPLHKAIRAVDITAVEEDENLMRVFFNDINVKNEDKQFFKRAKSAK